MGNQKGCCSPAYMREQKELIDALRDSDITETFQKPNFLLKSQNIKLEYHEKFYRRTTRPLFKIMYEDFIADLDALIESKRTKKSEEPKITIDDFCAHFMKIDPWNDPHEMEGTVLTIRKLFESDRDGLKDHDHPAHEHSLVNHGYLDIFNIKVLAFLMCKGEYHYKAKALYKMLWDSKNALEKKPMIGWSQLRLQPWVVKCFFYVNLYPVLHQDAFKEDL